MLKTGDIFLTAKFILQLQICLPYLRLQNYVILSLHSAGLMCSAANRNLQLQTCTLVEAKKMIVRTCKSPSVAATVNDCATGTAVCKADRRRDNNSKHATSAEITAAGFYKNEYGTLPS